MTVAEVEARQESTDHLAALKRAVEKRTAVIGIIGLGYVGLPLALRFSESGFRVLGFDIDPEKPRMLARGESYIKHIGHDGIVAAFGSGRSDATSDFSRLAECDAILICVPTPLGAHREPDLKYIRITAEQIGTTIRPGQLVVLESTTYPGTTREELLPRLENSGLKAGRDFFLAFSPEREDPGNTRFNTKTIPKLVGGIDEASLDAAAAVYGAAIDNVVTVSSPEIAEAAKLFENIFRSVNIALANEMKVVLDRLGINVWEVIEAAKTKPFGFMPFYPGPGLGGHCIPLDPFYLTWKAAEHGMWARFIELAGEVNTSMPRYVVDKTIMALNDDGKSVRGAKVLVLGLSYKANIDDDRESPSFEIIDLLRERGADVSYCDPHIPFAKKTRKHDTGMESVPCTAEEFARYDAIVVSTAHDAFLDRSLFRSSSLVIDTRNIVPSSGAAGRVVRA
jgi:UDP-N-acetyl-D-glucosamine dehydrogenase